jgi:hypothetical protein
MATLATATLGADAANGGNGDNLQTELDDLRYNIRRYRALCYLDSTAEYVRITNRYYDSLKRILRIEYPRLPIHWFRSKEILYRLYELLGLTDFFRNGKGPDRRRSSSPAAPTLNDIILVKRLMRYA